jgi:hypothetical protein
MMKNRKIKVLVLCQYYENYGYYNGTENWKSKDGHQFSFMIDSDDYFYDDDRVVETFKEVIQSKNNSLNRFQYVSHEREMESEDITTEVMELYTKKLGVV